MDDGGAVLGTLEQGEKKSLATPPLEELVGKTPNPNRYGARRDNKRVTSLRESAVSHLRSPQVFQAIELICFPQWFFICPLQPFSSTMLERGLNDQPQIGQKVICAHLR